MQIFGSITTDSPSSIYWDCSLAVNQLCPNVGGKVRIDPCLPPSPLPPPTHVYFPSVSQYRLPSKSGDRRTVHSGHRVLPHLPQRDSAERRDGPVQQRRPVPFLRFVREYVPPVSLLLRRRPGLLQLFLQRRQREPPSSLYWVR